MPKPRQIEPLLDPNKPDSDNRYPYYLLEPLHSPPVSTPNAIRWEPYDRPKFLRQEEPKDYRVVYGFIEYEERVSWADLAKYNMLPFDYDESLLFDLWCSFEKDKNRLLAYFVRFFRVTEGDDELRRMGLVCKLIGRNWTLAKARAEIKRIKE